MIRSRHVFLAIAILAATVFLATPRSGSASDDQILPRLGAHTFVPNNFIPGPFIRSYVRNGTGGGATNSVLASVVTLPDSTVILGLQTQVAMVAIDFEWQHAMKDWVAMRGRFEIFGRLGSSTSALLSEGITGVGEYELGWMFKLAQTEKSALSLDLYMQRSQGSFVNILDWLERIIEDGGLEPGNSIVRSRDSLRGIGALQYAHAYNALLGFSVHGSLGYGEKLDRNGDNDVIYAMRGGLSINLHDTTKVPFGFYVGYGLSDWTKGGENLRGQIADIAVRINYMGFDDFIAGIEISSKSVPVSGVEDDVRGTTGMFTLRYYY
jgi:hypothetical protein